MTLKYQIEKNVAEVIPLLTNILTQEIKKPYVQTSWDKNELNIKIVKMGSSEIKISVSDVGGKCMIQETKRNISMMHKPFVGEVEKIIDDILINKLGASKV